MRYINQPHTLKRIAASLTLPTVLTHGRQLVLHLQDDSLANVLQQADDLVVSELCQVDSVHGADVVAHVQLVTPARPQHQNSTSVSLFSRNRRWHIKLYCQTNVNILLSFM